MNGHSNPEASAFQAYVKERCHYLEICRSYHLAPLDLARLLDGESRLSLEDRLRVVRLIYRLRDLEGELRGQLEEAPFTEAASTLEREQLH
jgi:hypothetical protein